MSTRPVKAATTSSRRDPADAEVQLAGFIEKFDPDVAKLITRTRQAVRKRLPTAFELVYDNYNFFVIGYSATERASDAIVSVTGAANGVGLCFIRGAGLPDPHKLLIGSGKQTRFIRVPSVAVLARPEVEALIEAACAGAKTPLREHGRGVLIIKSISTKQRPRRK
jgi:uncharacterized protein DUF1801